MAYPAYQNNGGVAGAASGTSIAVTYPSSISQNDILIASLICDQNSTWQTPSGWTMINEGATTNHCSAIYYKRAAGSESGTVTFTTNASSTGMISGIIARFNGCITSGTPYENAVEDHRLTQTATAYAIIPAFSTSGAERLAVYIVSVENDVNVAAVTDWTEQFDLVDTSGTDSCHALGTRQYATASSIAEFHPGVSRNNYVSGYGFALIPASSNSQISGTITTATSVFATIQAKGSLSINISTVSSVSTTIKGRAPISANITTVSSVTGTIQIKGLLSINISTVSSISGTIQAKGSLSVNISTISSVSTTIKGRAPISENITTVSSVTGTIQAKGLLSINISTVSSLSGTIQGNQTGSGAITGNITTISSVTGTIQAKGSLTINISTVSSVTGTIQAKGALSVNISTFSALNGTIWDKPSGSLIANISTVSGVTGTIQAKGALLSNIAGSTNINVNLRAYGALNSLINTITLLNGILSGLSQIFGQIFGKTITSANIVIKSTVFELLDYNSLIIILSLQLSNLTTVLNYYSFIHDDIQNTSALNQLLNELSEINNNVLLNSQI